MKRLSLTLGALALGALCTHSASADTFSFSFTGSSFNGSGTITATEVGNTSTYNITNITGIVDGQTITGLLSGNTFDKNDNELFDSGTGSGNLSFDSGGVSFKLGTGANVSWVNIGEGNGSSSLIEIADLNPPGPGPDTTENVSLDVEKIGSTSPVPEPGTLALLGTGILGAAGTIRRRLMA
jgi:hypothetical protein